MVRFLYAILLGFSFSSVPAQDSTIRYQRPTNVILKLAPLWLIDADPALVGGVEIRTGQRTSVAGESGYGWPNWNNPSRMNQHAGTWRFKTEMRFYTGHYRVNSRKNIRVLTTYPLGNYLGFEMYAKLLTINHNWSYSDPTTAPSTSPANVLRQTRLQRNSLSFSVKLGRQIGWEDQAHQKTARLLWDIYAGVGVRFIYQNNGGDWETPGYTNFVGMFNRFNANGFGVTPILNLGIKLGFAL